MSIVFRESPFPPDGHRIQHALGEGHRALRAPASASVSSAGSHAPGAKTGGSSLRLSRHWLPQPAAQAAAASGDDAGGNGGLAHVRKFPRFHPFQDIRPVARNAVDQILAAVAALVCFRWACVTCKFFQSTVFNSPFSQPQQLTRFDHRSQSSCNQTHRQYA